MLSFLLSLDNDIMAANPFFSGRIPQDIFDAVEQYQQATGKSKTEILKNALTAYLGLPSEPAAIGAGSSRLEILENRLAQVERILGELQHQPNTLTEIDRQSEVEKQLSLESIQPTEVEERDKTDNVDYTDNNDEESDNQAESVDNSSDNDLDNVLESSEDDVIIIENTDNTNQSEFWTSSQINERLDVARKTLEGWNKRGNLPRTVKGHTIVGLAEKQKIDGRWQNTWEVRRD